ncbi:MAG: hypothetical protein M3126_01005 [Candidatus Eremiobacteraeota bacterium]|nr:hypothetical protein [Candidatus Eremiobacteraeota bacterium]
MKKWILAGLLLGGVALQTVRVDAAWYYNGSKQVTLTVTVTPSPITFVPMVRPTPVIARAEAHPHVAPVMIAYEPMRASDTIAAASGTVPVALTVKPDPTYAIFHIVPHTSSLVAGYGPNTYTCAYEVFASQPRVWQVTDWVYGSTSSGGSGLTTWPTNNYPTASALQWYAEGISSAFKPFSNAGQPGETPFNGPANTSKQVCFDLSLTVDPTVAAGTYQTTIQYNLRFYN